MSKSCLVVWGEPHTLEPLSESKIPSQMPGKEKGDGEAPAAKVRCRGLMAVRHQASSKPAKPLTELETPGSFALLPGLWLSPRT